MKSAPRILSAALALAALAAASVASASSPVLNAVRPPGGQRGTELELTLSGARLGDAQEILWYQPGITTLGLEPAENGNSVKANIRIEPDARLGLYEFRIRTATGISHLRTFTVGPFPEVAEAEPNNDFEQPQEIPLNVTVSGVAQNEDVDYYVVEARKGQRITAEVEGIRLGITLFDPYVAILDQDRFELARSDDAPLVRQDAIAQIEAPEDARYIIEVRESAYQGNGNCHYRLHVGTFPRSRTAVPLGGPAGETVEVRWIGDITGERVEAVTLPPEPNPDFGLVVEDERGVAPQPSPFRVSPFGNVIEAEPNNNHNEATPFPAPPIALNGVIETDGDVDHFAFEAKKGQAFDVRVYARQLGSPLDSVLWVAKKGGGNIEANDDQGGPDSSLRFTAPEDGTYIVGLRDHLTKGSPTHSYRIELTPVEPLLTLRPQNENPQIGVITAAVPKGNRRSLLINASRANFGGDLELRAEDLPDGVTLEAGTMTGNIATMPIVLAAAPEAEGGGRLATILGDLADPETSVPAVFSHTVELVQGRNNRPFWTRTVDRLAVAVAEVAPYSIEVVEPQAPLVRGGAMRLKVVATRAEGFTAPISVRLPWNPPGIGSSRSVSIPEGQTEASIPMNANGNAPLQTWKIVVDGSSNGPTGPITVSSQLAALTIAEPYVGFEFQRIVTEQGQDASLFLKVNQNTSFDGEATVELVGLPNNVKAETQTITQETQELVIPITVGDDAPVGTHKNLFCRVTITENGEPILHNIGSTQLRVDKPKPKETEDASASKREEKTDDKKKEKPEKPLSRLEQLRLEQAERRKAEQSQGDSPSESESEETQDENEDEDGSDSSSER